MNRLSLQELLQLTDEKYKYITVDSTGSVKVFERYMPELFGGRSWLPPEGKTRNYEILGVSDRIFPLHLVGSVFKDQAAADEAGLRGYYYDGKAEDSLTERSKLETTAPLSQRVTLTLPDDCPLTVPTEMLEFLDIMEPGAIKHGADSWLNPDGPKSSHKEMHDSMFHHLADSYADIRQDHDSGMDPLLHLACRALMTYTRKKKGVDDYRAPKFKTKLDDYVGKIVRIELRNRAELFGMLCERGLEYELGDYTIFENEVASIEELEVKK